MLNQLYQCINNDQPYESIAKMSQKPSKTRLFCVVLVTAKLLCTEEIHCKNEKQFWAVLGTGLPSRIIINENRYFWDFLMILKNCLITVIYLLPYQMTQLLEHSPPKFCAFWYTGLACGAKFATPTLQKLFLKNYNYENNFIKNYH